MLNPPEDTLIANSTLYLGQELITREEETATHIAASEEQSLMHEPTPSKGHGCARHLTRHGARFTFRKLPARAPIVMPTASMHFVYLS